MVLGPPQGGAAHAPEGRVGLWAGAEAAVTSCVRVTRDSATAATFSIVDWAIKLLATRLLRHPPQPLPPRMEGISKQIDSARVLSHGLSSESADRALPRKIGRARLRTANADCGAQVSHPPTATWPLVCCVREYIANVTFAAS